MPRPTGQVARLRAFLKSAEFRRLWRYSAVSVVSTVVSLVGFYVFYRTVKIDGVAGKDHGSAVWSNVSATAIATIPSYYLNRAWAWGKSGRSHLMREVVPFWVISALSLLLSTGVVWVANHEAHHITSSTKGVTIILLLANLATYGFLWIAKFLFFNKVLFKHTAPAAEAESLGSVLEGVGADL